MDWRDGDSDGDSGVAVTVIVGEGLERGCWRRRKRGKDKYNVAIYVVSVKAGDGQEKRLMVMRQYGNPEPPQHGVGALLQYVCIFLSAQQTQMDW